MDGSGVWQGILKWSLAQTANEPTPSSDLKPLSDDDKAFLQQVFDSLIVDEVKRMKIVKQILSLPEDPAEILALHHSKG